MEDQFQNGHCIHKKCTTGSISLEFMGVVLIECLTRSPPTPPLMFLRLPSVYIPRRIRKASLDVCNSMRHHTATAHNRPPIATCALLILVDIFFSEEHPRCQGFKKYEHPRCQGFKKYDDAYYYFARPGSVFVPSFVLGRGRHPRHADYSTSSEDASGGKRWLATWDVTCAHRTITAFPHLIDAMSSSDSGSVVCCA